jgi:hypothetical protein
MAQTACSCTTTSPASRVVARLTSYRVSRTPRGTCCRSDGGAEAGGRQVPRRGGRSRSSRAPPGGHGPRPLDHQACSGCIVLAGVQHADRDRPTSACWGVPGTGPEAGSTAVVTSPWTSRRHGGAPETHAVARWAAAAGRPRHRHPCHHRTRYATRKAQAPTSPAHVPTSRGVETTIPCAIQPG